MKDYNLKDPRRYPDILPNTEILDTRWGVGASHLIVIAKHKKEFVTWYAKFSRDGKYITTSEGRYFTREVDAWIDFESRN